MVLSPTGLMDHSHVAGSLLHKSQNTQVQTSIDMIALSVTDMTDIAGIFMYALWKSRVERKQVLFH